MSRMVIPSKSQAPAASVPLLDKVNRQLGTVPNLMKVMGSSSVALEGYLSLSDALRKGQIDTGTAERIALIVAQLNACNYCLSAHSYLASNVAKLDASEIEAARRGTSTDPKAAAAVEFAAKVVNARGHVNDADLTEMKAAGYSGDEVIEIVLHVALSIMTNYVNNVALTDIDFPIAD